MSDDEIRQQITIVVQGFQFTLTTPYRAGHVLNDIEAGILNREWTEGVRQGFAENVREMANSTQLTPEIISKLQKELELFATAFGFKALSQRFNSHPIVREAHRIAKQLLDERLNGSGRRITPARYQQLLSQLMNHHEIVDQARKQLESAKDVASSIIGLEP